MLLPTNGCSLELCIPFLKLTNREQASVSWKPGPLAANETRNMIGAAASSYIHVVGSQYQRETHAELEWAAVSGEERYVSTLITDAKETMFYRV